MRKFLGKVVRVTWGAYAVTVFATVSLATTFLVAVLPGLSNRRQAARLGARFIFFASGIRLHISEIGKLPNEACVVVANHASYLDGVILTAALPPNFSFVIKREITSVPLAHLLLRRLGSEFVERFDRHRGASDARRILRKANDGEALAFFPEGTFTAQCGLQRFRTGAFAAAARAGMPVVPVIIRGARQVLPAERWLPSRAPLEVLITTPIDLSASEQGHRASRLLSLSRERILEHLDEPDLISPQK
ncbi:MAG: 1-acyl-sn-glycerol-3-phosphate acyltransferase [Gammaproteobacteria bacterium]|nr:MAG: 1-acyl-sn-glycerol-3-phosphate acyltransferase [Gammaproteobacteria bacterium]